MSRPSVALAPHATPVDELVRLRRALGPSTPRLLMKRDDLLSFALGGNKVRKLQTVAAEALEEGADTLVTCGGVQSNHARVTAAAGAALGLRVVLVLSGEPPARPTANVLLDQLFGAEVRHVATRADRAPMMEAVAQELRATGRRPFIVPLGASTPTGAMGMARGVAEVVTSGHWPQLIVCATSSGGTQAGLIAGAALLGLETDVLGISADESSASLSPTIAHLLAAMAGALGAKPSSLRADVPVTVDDRFVGEGYGIPTAASTEALALVAQTEGILLDPVYTAKAMAGLLARIRNGTFTADQTLLFWHTGGQVANFA